MHYKLSLPTEAEWEYAARGADSRKYPWGDEWSSALCCNSDNQGPKGRTFPVGSFPRGDSWCRVSDMAGNVREWCADWFSSSYYGTSPETDPMGASTGRSRVLRGGSWCNVGSYCRSAYRDFNYPGYGSDSSGFRCSRTP